MSSSTLGQETPTIPLSTTTGGSLSRGGDTAGFKLTGMLGLFLLVFYWFFTNAELRVTDSLSFELNWQVLLRLAVMGCCGLYGGLFLWRTLPQFFQMPSIFLTAYLAWSSVTVVIAADPKYSFAALFAFLCLALFTPAVLEAVGTRGVVLTSLALLTLFLMGCWITYYFYPALGRDPYFVLGDGAASYRLAGLAHPNRVGRIATLCAGFALTAGYRQWASWRVIVPVIVFATISNVATDSRTSLAAQMAVMGLLIGRRTGLRPILIAAMFVLPVILVVGSLRLSEAIEASSRTGDASEIYSLNGRLDLWTGVVQQLAESPVWGYGYGCQRFVVEPLQVAWAVDPHNLWLNVAAGGGMIALFIFTILMANLGWQLFADKCDVPDFALILILIDGLTGSCLFSPVPNAMTFAWLLAIFWRPFDRQEENAGTATRSSSSWVTSPSAAR